VFGPLFVSGRRLSSNLGLASPAINDNEDAAFFASGFMAGDIGSPAWPTALAA
jgi:hypothetical protein